MSLRKRAHSKSKSVAPSPVGARESILDLAAAENALRRWLEWNTAYERSTEEMLKAQNLAEAQERMDAIDRLRVDAVELTVRTLRGAQ